MSGVARKQNLNLNPKVRVIAKIRGSSHLDGLSTSWFSVHNNIRDGIFSHSLTFSLGDRPVAASGGGGRKEAYVVDYCYDQNEKNDLVFEREVKPFINEVFDGRNATIIACGARGTGKSYLFQGKDDEPGLTVLAVDEMLRLAADNGKSIAVSFYEVDQDHHVNDLLDPNRQQVFVLKDAHGKTQLKGLSQVPVTSMSQFHNFYGGGTNPRKSIQKAVTELPKRSHKGLIVYVSSHGGEKLDVSVSKLNFVDLAGYQDARRKSIDGQNLVESTRNINKSIHAIHNVVYSLKANETHVPYRESKITTMLQDSLGGAGRILMVTCLNPSFCQESIYMVKLASRSCQGTTWAITDSTKKASSSARPMVPSSHNSRMLGSVSTSLKKQTVSRGHISGKKAHSSTSTLKARKLFDESSDLISQKITVQLSSSNNVPTVESVMHEEEQLTSNVAKEASSLEVEAVSLFAHEDSNSVSVDVSPVAAVSSTCETTILDKEVSPVAAVSSTCETTILDKEVSPVAAVSITCEATILDKEASPPAISSTCEITVLDKTDKDQNKTALYTGELSMFDEGTKIDKENNSSIVNLGGSPPISAQLQELSNSLKLLCSSTPSCIDITPKNDAFHNQTSTDIGEPATPSSSMRVTNREITSFCSPWEKFNARSTGMKNSLVQDYLRLLNTADKEELRKLKGIGEKRATYILELREDCPEPFKNLDDLKDIGLSAKQVTRWLKKEVGGLFD
nr:kinesin-like protein KIN-10C isoform X2 [Populus alba]